MATVAMNMVMMMKGQNNINSKTDAEPTPSKGAVFHDFLGGKAPTFDANSSVSSAGKAPFSSSSDLASERQVGSHSERISCYGPKTDLSVTEVSNRFVGSKRSNSDSTFMSLSREGFPQRIPENSHVMKMLRSASGEERPRVSHYEGLFHGARQMRPVPAASFMLQPTNPSNANLVKSERSIPMNAGGSSTPYSTCIGHTSSLAYQMPLSRSRDGTSGPSVLSQLAADEGSRTGNKGSGLLSSINAGNVASERNPSALLPSGGKIKPALHSSDPEPSNSPSRRGLTSTGRQMTIIYGGQVHVFDDVPPNKADVIMALAGSSGGSWCTTLPKSSVRATTNENCLPIGENETSLPGDSSLPQKYHKILTGASSIQGLSSKNQGGTINKDTGTPSQAGESSLQGKQEV